MFLIFRQSRSSSLAYGFNLHLLPSCIFPVIIFMYEWVYRQYCSFDIRSCTFPRLITLARSSSSSSLPERRRWRTWKSLRPMGISLNLRACIQRWQVSMRLCVDLICWTLKRDDLRDIKGGGYSHDSFLMMGCVTFEGIAAYLSGRLSWSCCLLWSEPRTACLRSINSRISRSTVAEMSTFTSSMLLPQKSQLALKRYISLSMPSSPPWSNLEFMILGRTNLLLCCWKIFRPSSSSLASTLNPFSFNLRMIPFDLFSYGPSLLYFPF